MLRMFNILLQHGVFKWLVVSTFYEHHQAFDDRLQHQAISHRPTFLNQKLEFLPARLGVMLQQKYPTPLQGFNRLVVPGTSR